MNQNNHPTNHFSSNPCFKQYPSKLPAQIMQTAVNIKAVNNKNAEYQKSFVINTSPLLPYYQYMNLKTKANGSQQQTPFEFQHSNQPYYQSNQHNVYGQYNNQNYNSAYQSSPNNYYSSKIQPIPSATHISSNKQENRLVYANQQFLFGSINQNSSFEKDFGLRKQLNDTNQNKRQQIFKNSSAYRQQQKSSREHNIYSQQNQIHNNHYRYRHNSSQQKKSEQDNQNVDLSSNEEWSEEEEQEEILFQIYQSRKSNHYGQKSKSITKKKDPILDSPEEIKKWIDARKRNYPGLTKKLLKLHNFQQQNAEHFIEKENEQLSKLQSKIRKKLLIINGDSRSLMRKIKSIEILRRIIQDPKILKKQRKIRSNYDFKIKSLKQSNWKQPEIEILKAQSLQSVQKQTILTPKTYHKKAYKEQISESEESIEPFQSPANKIFEPLTKQKMIQEKQHQKEELLKTVPSPQLFQFVGKQKKSDILEIQNSINDVKTFKNGQRSLEPETIIYHLRQKQKQDRQSLNTLFDYKCNSYSYNYRIRTLQTSLKLDEIFNETTYLLQAIRYIAKENFFDRQVS